MFDLEMYTIFEIWKKTHRMIELFRAPTLVHIGTLRFSVSNGVEIMSGDVLEPEF